MLAGSLTRENLTDLFRTLSQKRKHGIVSVQSTDSSFEITFLSGRIAEVKELGWLTSPAIYERLRISGRLPDDVLDSDTLGQMSLSTLYASLVEAGHVSHDDFMMARSSLALDMLHSLHFIPTGVFQFDQRLIDFDDRISLKLSPGQLLLDFVELETNEERYQELISQFSGSSLGVLVGDDIGAINTQEGEFLRGVGEGGELEDIMSRVLLSENDFRSVLLSLQNRGAIFVYPLAPEQASEELRADDDTNDSVVDLVGLDVGNDQADSGIQVGVLRESVIGANQQLADEDVSVELSSGSHKKQSISGPAVLNPPASVTASMSLHSVMVMVVAVGLIAGICFLMPSRIRLFLNGVEDLMRFLS